MLKMFTTLLLTLTVACTSISTDCSSIDCIKAKERRDYTMNCIQYYQRAAIKRGFKDVYPYDDPIWQHEHCTKEARRMIK